MADQINDCPHQITYAVLVKPDTCGQNSRCCHFVTCRGRFVEVDEILYNIEIQQFEFECELLRSPLPWK